MIGPSSDPHSGSPADVVVVGAGVIGLTTALRLAKSGLKVRVYAADRCPSRTSSAAGAIWDPLYAEHPHRGRWAEESLGRFARMAVDGVPGVRMLSGIEASQTLVEIPGWSRNLPEFRVCERDELPTGFAVGWRYRAPVIDMPAYLAFLGAELQSLGAEVVRRRLTTLSEAMAEARVVVNCGGYGARDLVPDPSVRPIRGQLVAVRNPGIAEFFIEQSSGIDDSTYFLPQGDDVLLLGGCAEPDADGYEPDTTTAEAIVRRCAEIDPRIGHSEILEHRVGIRPHRPTVRLELVTTQDGHVIHNYGHSGSGVSLAWGCATEVLDLVTPLPD
ncbi:amino acid oxidase [Paractinoplanes abujensis]|uniref:D-amino-acid oxidase n=1 Tax=Paractinoplanes abujensis TaxID=882441 RepID=A0A7W7CNQ6_9ACTN|nr:FAD-dependent oxidoreductase [Actinoplanes abujensis]MBB4690408.1 D-amino-acid oxidase [Actinoplanes abujensis]GID21172.1 amino acid oxidase [Actinoplanes abujensis]